MCTGSHMCAEVRGQFHKSILSARHTGPGNQLRLSGVAAGACIPWLSHWPARKAIQKQLCWTSTITKVAHFLFEPNNPTVNYPFNLPGSTVNTCGHRASNFLYITKHKIKECTAKPQKATQEQGITPNTARPWGSVSQAGKGHHAWATEGRGNHCILASALSQMKRTFSV